MKGNKFLNKLRNFIKIKLCMKIMWSAAVSAANICCCPF